MSGDELAMIRRRHQIAVEMYGTDLGVQDHDREYLAFIGDRDRADLLAEVDHLRTALEMIAGLRPCRDNLLGDKDIARIALGEK